MIKLAFEWDEVKAIGNIRKHHVAFEEAMTIFNDAMLLTYHDSAHSQSEYRYISIGVSVSNRVLLVCHTERHNNIRLISCRKATKKEALEYAKGWDGPHET
jgi:uncharacterized DUF497 family protein